jgi:hypothetical protein
VKQYNVTISYRTHFSSLKRAEVTYTVKAPNKGVAALRAGWMMRVDEHWHVADSLTMEVNIA